MDLPEGVFLVPDFLAPDECRSLVEATEAIGYDPAPIVTASGVELRPEIRNNTRVIVDDPDRAGSLWDRLRPEVPGFLADRRAIGLDERFRSDRYDPGERFAPHRDAPYRRDNGETSLLTVLLYLNEGFVGGQTVVERFPVTPRLGLALVFPHDRLHEGAAVTEGRKYVLRSDVMFGRVGQIRG